MTDYPIGTVVIATVRGVPGQQAVRVNTQSLDWLTPVPVKNYLWHSDDVVTDIEVFYTPPQPRMAEPDPVEWQVVAHTATDLHRRRFMRLPQGTRGWVSEYDVIYRWTDLIDPEPYRPDDAAVTP